MRSWLPTAIFRVVAGRKEKLGGSDAADRIAGDEVRGQLIDDGGDHHIEIRDLIMQFEVTAGQGLEADAIGGSWKGRDKR